MSQLRAAGRYGGSSLIVLWFLVLFVLAICVAAVTLSASQLQSRLQALSQSGAPYSVWQIERIRKSWDSQQAAITQLSERVSQLQKAWSDADDKYQLAQADLFVSQSDYNTARSEVVAKIAFLDPSFDTDRLRDLEDVQANTVISKTIGSLGSGGVPEDQWVTLQQLNVRFEQTWTAYTQAAQKARLADQEAFNLKVDFEREQKSLQEAQDKVKQIIDPQGKLEPADFQRVDDLISEFAFMEKFALGTLYRFAILPSEFLTIVLVVTMGVLGSTLQLTYSYYRDGRIQQISLFFIRPMLGAITSLVVFVLLKAGVLIVTDSSKLGEVAPLNPFFVAFVGIVSGLLSENALETIRRVGETWFRNSAAGGSARWAYGVKPLLGGTKTLQALADHADIPVERLQAWADQQEPVPPDMQRLFAAWLERDLRDLFTDLPPRPA